MLLGLHDWGIRPDLILFADTRGEKPRTMDHRRLAVIIKGLLAACRAIPELDVNEDVRSVSNASIDGTKFTISVSEDE